MPGASFEAVTGRLGVGAIAFFGLFLIVDGMVGVFDLVEAMGKSVTWGVIGLLPTVVVTYIVGLFCLGIARWLSPAFPHFHCPSRKILLRFLGWGVLCSNRSIRSTFATTNS
jgi:hypothetical protein